MEKKIEDLTDIELAKASNEIWSQMMFMQGQLQNINNEIAKRSEVKSVSTNSESL